MQREPNIQVKPPFIQKYKKGYPLIHKDSVQNPSILKEEGIIFNLVDQGQKFIAKGYFGIQNKGIGWVLSDMPQEKIDYPFFKKKIEQAIQHRQSFFHSNDTNAFRVFNGEGDGIGGLTIEYFAGYYLIHWYSEGVYAFKNHIIRALDELTNYKAIYEKKRFDKKGQYMDDDDFVKGERGEFPIIVKENGMNYAVYLNDGAMVGIFLDQRDVRKVIRDEYAGNKNVLNTFSYTGAFSIAASLGGATKTTSVDLAKRSKGKTIEQFSVNGIDFEQHDIVVMDVFDYFKYANRKNLKFDLIILDPPSFARSKKRTFSSAKDYPGLIQEAISITENNGVIVASTNNATFGMKKFKEMVDQAFKAEKKKYRVLESYSLPEDFRTKNNYREGNYLKVLFIRLEN